MKTATLTNLTLSQAARISVSDPYYMNPVKIDGTYYLSGAIDLYPLEAAKLLGHEVTMGFARSFYTLTEQPATKSSFRYDNNARLRKVNDQEADYWIDLSDTSKMYARSGFNPDVNILWGPISPFRATIALGVPESYEEFVRMINEQWKFGKERAIEAFDRSAYNDKTHIRNMHSKNASRSLREEMRPVHESEPKLARHHQD